MGEGPLPIIVRPLSNPSFKGRALILGGASCVWDDVKAVERMLGRPWDGLVIACNDIGIHWAGRLDHWCTLHPEKFRKWKDERRAKGYPDGYTTWGRSRYKGVDRSVQCWAGGSSGMLAVAVAVDGLRIERAILCGIPMTKTPHFEQSTVHVRGRVWNSVDAHWRSWTKRSVLEKMYGYVRSMSGRTKDLLGCPDREWLLGEQEEAA